MNNNILTIPDLLKEAAEKGNAEKYNKIANYLYKNFNIRGAEINLLALHLINHVNDIMS